MQCLPGGWILQGQLQFNHNCNCQPCEDVPPHRLNVPKEAASWERRTNKRWLNSKGIQLDLHSFQCLMHIWSLIFGWIPWKYENILIKIPDKKLQVAPNRQIYNFNKFESGKNVTIEDWDIFMPGNELYISKFDLTVLELREPHCFYQFSVVVVDLTESINISSTCKTTLVCESFPWFTVVNCQNKIGSLAHWKNFRSQSVWVSISLEKSPWRRVGARRLCVLSHCKKNK